LVTTKFSSGILYSGFDLERLRIILMGTIMASFGEGLLKDCVTIGDFSKSIRDKLILVTTVDLGVAAHVAQ
jgi:hypothetical protein